MNIARLIEYNTWANALLAGQIATLGKDLFKKETGGSFPSMRATMAHMIDSDWLWLNRWKGIPLADVPVWPSEDASMLNETWQAIREEMVNVARTFVDRPDTPIKFTTRAGKDFVLPFYEIVFQVSHHGSYHRGQLTNMIRIVGGEPVSTDYFLFAIRK